MWRAVIVAVAVVLGAESVSIKADLMFLTRDGCVNTPEMVTNLDDALTALRWPHDYQYINISKLSPKDVRTGYSTPWF